MDTRLENWLKQTEEMSYGFQTAYDWWIHPEQMAQDSQRPHVLFTALAFHSFVQTPSK